ncbi:calcium-transporting ATPase 8, plasma membrane-type-like [Olea europaea subsp. europaea]|uniref:Calcium-transporting ATPase 8, plasma membrane-type-like n=1 Tax=Olea europaea subsp. europaea TaxID=158383 RepID=A0A8S0TYE9_OLEEU|nr:calcium-transporting ATPase 8, plasma membrane-type-like [Olea europaea subsp. europaea]
MTVVKAYSCRNKIDPPDNKSLLPPNIISLLIESIAQNTTGSVFVPKSGGALEVSGSPTEKAILQWGVNLGMDFNAAKSKSMIIHAFPFNSEKKRGGVAVKLVIGAISSDVIYCLMIIHAFPFNSEKKRGGVAVKLVIGEISSDVIYCLHLSLST